jgi:hypothetical protein
MMSIKRILNCLLTLLLLATLICPPLWAAERKVQLTIPGCDS